MTEFNPSVSTDGRDLKIYDDRRHGFYRSLELNLRDLADC